MAGRGPDPTLHECKTRQTYADVDLSALSDNLGALRKALAGSAVYGVVKADAYGHGLVPAAEHLAREGIDGFCVALTEEGIALRKAGLRAPILVLNGVYGDAHRAAVAHGLTPVVYDRSDVRAFEAAGRSAGETVGVHLLVDTGMSRLGVSPEGLDGLLDALETSPHIRVSGLMSHLASAGEDHAQTRAQLERFWRAVEKTRERGHRPLLHIANSAAALGVPEARLDLVRCGLALYGAAPARGLGDTLRPALRLCAEVVHVQTLPPGRGVGYGASFITQRESRIATLAIGYGDGVSRALSNRGQVLIRGHRCPVVGRVSMDLMGVDVTDLPDCQRGDEAVLLGTQGDQRIRAEEVAAWAGTIPYEVWTALSARVPRRYPKP